MPRGCRAPRRKGRNRAIARRRAPRGRRAGRKRSGRALRRVPRWTTRATAEEIYPHPGPLPSILFPREGVDAPPVARISVEALVELAVEAVKNVGHWPVARA